MYEDITYEYLLQRILKRMLQANPNLDTREGSMSHLAVAATTVEHQNLYIEADFILDATFADTAPREFLIERAKERGLSPYPAAFALLKGEFNVEVPIGNRFSLINDVLNYVVTRRIDFGVYELQCETAGSVGNERLGQIIPATRDDYIEGLTHAELTEILIPGEDEEETERFRQRYFGTLNARAFGGNVQDYKEKTHALPGVGGVKVYPIWNGGGTVKLVIISSEFEAPSVVLVDAVQTAIDPVPNQGIGDGIAPIGHVVTVEGVAPQTVDIAIDIAYQDGWTWPDVEPYAVVTVDEYFESLGAAWEAEPALIVRISQIETRFLDLPGVIDVANATLNGTAQNLVLGADEIPARGDIVG